MSSGNYDLKESLVESYIEKMKGITPHTYSDYKKCFIASSIRKNYALFISICSKKIENKEAKFNNIWRTATYGEGYLNKYMAYHYQILF